MSKGRNVLFLLGATALSGASSLSRLDDHTHLDKPHSVGFLQTSDHPDADTVAWQHTTRTIDRHPNSCGIRTHNPRKRTVADHALDCAAPWIGEEIPNLYVFWTVELDGGMKAVSNTGWCPAGIHWSKTPYNPMCVSVALVMQHA